MNLTNLDDITRIHMREEIQTDIATATLYMSDRLSPQGAADYPDLLMDAVDHGTSASLAAELRRHGRLNSHEMAVSRRGNPFWRRVPVTAADTLAEGEFNRFYIRGLCVRAMNQGIDRVQVYRAKAVFDPRPESTARIGLLIAPPNLLADLRVHTHVDTALGVPAGPNSGLSIQLVA